MTTWSGSRIAQWLRAAGFEPEHVVHGTALSLAASGGADHYSHNPTSLPHTETRGLYALRVELVGGDPGGELYDPVFASRTLRQLFTANGNRWDWHPVHVSGAALAQVPTVRLMLRAPGPHEPTRPTYGFAASVERLLALRNAMSRMGANRAPL